MGYLFTALEWLSWVMGHVWLVGAFVLYIATMAARVPFKWPVIAPVIAAMAFMGAGQVYYQKGYASGTKAEKAEWQGRLNKALEAERSRAKLKADLLASNNKLLSDKLAEIDTAVTAQNDAGDKEGEAAAQAMTRAIERARARWDADQAKVEPPVNLCTKEKPDATAICPKTVCPKAPKCRPALLQRIDPSFVRPK